MKVIFLDIDGVLNTDRYLKILKKQNGGVSYYGMEFNFDPRAMRNLKEII